ncbi:MAG: hypothetical protein AB7G68_19320 [Nitrospiraceae bacterium]
MTGRLGRSDFGSKQAIAKIMAEGRRRNEATRALHTKRRLTHRARSTRGGEVFGSLA